MKENKKVKDTGADISSHSRLDNYWTQRGFLSYFMKLRKPQPALKGKENVQELYEIIISTYGFKGIEFGNWVNNESRFNYLVSVTVALQDIQRVLKFPHNNIGLEKISLAFGARGGGSALAHFEPHTWIINLTRYSRDSEFYLSGGIGALAHEYGHALDYYFGSHHAASWKFHSLTIGRFTATNFDIEVNEKTLPGIVNKIIKTVIWQDYSAAIKTNYYEKLLKKFKGNDYWFRHNEIFARCFEQYIHYKLKKAGIINYFLTENTKYDAAAYLDQPLLKKCVPLFDKLIAGMRSKL